MMIETIAGIFIRDLKKLQEEISAYKREEDLWIVKPGISNSAGNLALHLIGNINHFIGATLGNTGYVRDRDSEFTLKNIAKADILKNIEAVITVIESTFLKMNDHDLAKDFPLEKHGEIVKNDHMLLHLLTHLSYHIGQINYHRRLLS